MVSESALMSSGWLLVPQKSVTVKNLLPIVDYKRDKSAGYYGSERSKSLKIAVLSTLYESTAIKKIPSVLPLSSLV